MKFKAAHCSHPTQITPARQAPLHVDAHAELLAAMMQMQMHG